MYFLGHMAWACVFAVLAWAFVPGVKRAGKLFVPLVLLLGVLPDSDLLLGDFGIVHRTVTHSFVFWGLLFVPVFWIFRLRAVPYFVAVVQHFAFGDFLMGKVMLFWPFYPKFLGLGFGMPSTVDVALETAGLVLAAAMLFYIGDLKRLLAVDKKNVAMIVPFLALVVSALFFISHWGWSTTIVSYILSSELILILAAGHIVLTSFLALSTVQGLRAFKSKSNSLDENKTLPDTVS